VQQHSNCRCHVREPSVAALRAAPGLVSSQREQRPLFTQSKKTAQAHSHSFHHRASFPGEYNARQARILHFEQGGIAIYQYTVIPWIVSARYLWTCCRLRQQGSAESSTQFTKKLQKSGNPKSGI
jgi:hypothetical protein